MKIQAQFFFLFLIVFVILTVRLFQNASNQKENIDTIQKIRIHEFSQTFHEIIDLKVSKPKIFAYDYSYWDEMVDFTKNRDTEWAHINLDEGLKTFDSDYVYVYDAKGSMIYETYDHAKYTSIADLIDPKTFNFEHPVIKNYFIVSHNRPIQIFIAPIQHSDDMKRTGKPFGYLVIAKAWTPDFIQDFQKITKQPVTLKTMYQIAQNNFDVVYPLKGEDGKAVDALAVNLATTAGDALHKMSQANMLSIIIVGILGMGIVGLFVYLRIVIPLQQISRAMRSQNSYPIQQLMQKENEFGQIAHLVNQFFNQKNILESQLKRTYQAEQEQRKLKAELHINNQILEQKVEERTKELEAANHTLDERVKTEIARRHEQEQLLIQQARFVAMGEMIGNIAHQWRQPLNALSLLLQNIIFAYEGNRIDHELMDRVNTKGNLLINTMSTTIDDFRNFFKPNRDTEQFNVAEQLGKTLDILQGTLESNRIVVEKNIAPELTMTGFPNEFSQVIINIINNAKDALSEHSVNEKRIRLQGYETADEIILQISDNAGGIPESILEKIFDPYFTTKIEGKGTGIGLYMSKVIVESNMSGKLIASNDDQGAVFTLHFSKSMQKDSDA
jgi:signal transduction histidine kinase